MLFIVEWTVPVENRVAVWNAFGNMSEEDHLQSQGSVKMVTRYHKLAGNFGLNIMESDNAEDVMKWCMNWSTLAEMNMYPVLGDSEAQKCVQESLLFEKKEKSEKSENESAVAPVDDDSTGMLFLVEWTRLPKFRVQLWNAFGNMSEKDLQAPQGSVKMISRYHKLAGDSGLNIVRSDNAEDLMKWCMKYSHMAEINICPVIEDAGAKRCAEQSAVFEKK